MSDFVASQIRTLVPIIVGYIFSLLTSAGIEVDQSAEAALGAFLAAFFSALYYLIVRLIEKHWPQAGWLLGVPKQPDYVDKR